MKIVIDNSNIINICYCSMISIKQKENGKDYVIKEEDIPFFFHLYLKKLMPFITTYKDVIFCGEGKGSTTWRKSIYPPYKETRKSRNDNPNFNYINDCYRKCEELLKLFNGKVLRVDNCEADDCIYQVCKYYAEKGESIKILSSDKDLAQIMNFYPEYVTQVNPSTFVELQPNPNIILEKCVVGDISDNIKPFKGIGPKTFEKMLNDKALWNKKIDPEIFEKVEKIIDLRKYPKEYQEAIVEEIKKPFNKMNTEAIEKFMLDNGLKSCYNAWTSTWLPDINAMEFEPEDAMDEIMDLLGGRT